jgi:hypothetical protein
MAKTHFSGTGHPAKSPESSLPHVATTLRKPSPSYPTDTAFGRILELYHHHFIAQPESVTKQPTRTAKFDVKAPPEAHVDDPPKLPDGYEPKPSPLLKDAARGVVFQAAAVELDQEKQELVQENQELAEYVARRRQQARDSAARARQRDPEAVREKDRVKKARQRERKTLEAEAQGTQQTKGGLS